MATFSDLNLLAPTNSTVSLHAVGVLGNTSACVSGTLVTLMNDSAVSVTVVDPSSADSLAATLRFCPGPGSGISGRADCSCLQEQPAVLDFGEILVERAYSLQLYCADATDRPLAGRVPIVYLDEMPRQISFVQAQYIDRSTTPDGMLVMTFGAQPGKAAFMTVVQAASGSAANGIATLNVTVSRGFAGQFTLICLLNPSSSTQMVRFRTVERAVASLAIVQQPAATVGGSPVGALVGIPLALQPQVRVLDANLNPVPGIVVLRCGTACTVGGSGVALAVYPCDVSVPCVSHGYCCWCSQRVCNGRVRACAGDR
jgi:hypothetical protein